VSEMEYEETFDRRRREITNAQEPPGKFLKHNWIFYSRRLGSERRFARDAEHAALCWLQLEHDKPVENYLTQPMVSVLEIDAQNGQEEKPCP
jgi:hypothetical protein